MSILIISHKGDRSTDDVIEWLHSYNKKVYRINTESPVVLNSIEIPGVDSCYIDVGGTKIALDQVKSFWHRRGNFSIAFPQLTISDDFPFKEELLSHVKEEKSKLAPYFHFQLKKKKYLGNVFKANLNKIITLQRALDLGIAIPATLITTRKDDLLKFKFTYECIVSKPISDSIMLVDHDIGSIMSYTTTITDAFIDNLSDNFAASLFQQEIKKKYELRIFYLDGEFYSMAIFSQADPGTSVDFRRYNKQHPNRTVPFNLPNEIKIKLHALMEALQLNTGSIDMAVNLKNEYVFFEVNPVGQFGMTSYPCNYFLEKKIAKYLIDDE